MKLLLSPLVVFLIVYVSAMQYGHCKEIIKTSGANPRGLAMKLYVLVHIAVGLATAWLMGRGAWT